MTNDELAQALAAKLQRLELLEQLYAESQRRLEAQVTQGIRLSLELMALKAKRRDEVSPEYVTKEAA